MYKALRETWDSLISPGEQFEITEIKVRGETIKAYANAPPSLREVWQASAQFADRDYLVYQDERWTYADAHRDVAAIAAWFKTQGITSGDRVALALRNYPEWLLCYLSLIHI